LFWLRSILGSRVEGELVWRVKLVTEFETGETTEVEVALLSATSRRAWPTSGFVSGKQNG
jgi:hypothetical protein